MSFVAPAATSVGHVHLRVADLDRAITFYSEVLGFTLNLRYGTQAAFLGAGGYHHHIGLNTWDSLNACPLPRSTLAFTMRHSSIPTVRRWRGSIARFWMQAMP